MKLLDTLRGFQEHSLCGLEWSIIFLLLFFPSSSLCASVLELTLFSILLLLLSSNTLFRKHKGFNHQEIDYLTPETAHHGYYKEK